MVARNWLLLLLTGLLLAVASHRPAPALAQSPEEMAPLRFAIVPYKSPRSLAETYDPLLHRLEERLQRPVHLLSTRDVATFLHRGQAREYDLLLAPPTLLLQLEEAGYRVIARGAPDFRGGVVVLAGSAIHEPADFRGKRVAAIGRHSYGGYLFFHHRLEEAGIDPHEELELFFTRQVDTIVYGVLSSRYDAGVIRLDTLETPAVSPFRQRLRVVFESVDIPQFPFMVKGEMDDQAVAVILEELVKLAPSSPEDLKILQSLQVSRIEPATTNDYQEFLRLIKQPANSFCCSNKPGPSDAREAE
ncbi:phosphate/phosphite/phosphonate ABC transporter substrate-binding protein [Desulfurivibrio sp. D14AmB]|uniref:phosphate/phosphite/phosphonate ABC transporter substrate-binding protein n=1 Tax=Desulfurivibrio sp. D14AmB TaxID=3374370 RepID=UPI00376EE5D0